MAFQREQRKRLGQIPHIQMIVPSELPQNISVKRLVYSWHPFSRANLINSAGLPASTFKTDFYVEKNKPLNYL